MKLRPLLSHPPLSSGQKRVARRYAELARAGLAMLAAGDDDAAFDAALAAVGARDDVAAYAEQLRPLARGGGGGGGARFPSPRAAPGEGGAGDDDDDGAAMWHGVQAREIVAPRGRALSPPGIRRS